MYINETHIIYYAIAAIIGLFAGMLVDWMNKRLPDYKKVFSKFGIIYLIAIHPQKFKHRQKVST